MAIMENPYSNTIWSDKRNQFIKILNQKGEELFNNFLKKYNNPIYIISSSYPKIYRKVIKHFSREEIEQMGLIALWKTILIYNPDKGKLSTILTFKVLAEINSSNKKYIDQISNININWQNVKVIGINKIDEPYQIVIFNELEQSINKFMQSLSEKEKRLLELKNNNSNNNIAKIENVSPQAISSRISNIYEKARSL